jgi:hypothetical protein
MKNKKDWGWNIHGCAQRFCARANSIFALALALNIFRGLRARANAVKRFRKIALKFKIFSAFRIKKLSDQKLQTTSDVA